MSKYASAIPSEMARNTADIIAAFANMCIDHDAMPLAFNEMDAMRIAHAVSGSGPRRLGFLFAPSHSGKSSLIRAYIRNRIVPEMVAEDPSLAGIDPIELAHKQRRVLHVTMGENATVKSLASDILYTLEDEDPFTGTRATLWRRVHKAMKALGIELLVIDEIQHLASSNYLVNAANELATTTLADNKVTDALKVIAIRGTVPVILAGIEQARTYISPSTQVTGRMLFDIKMQPLDWTVPDQRKSFTTFAGRLALEMRSLGLVDEAPALIYGDTIARLWLASKGRLGMLCRIVEKATIIALYAGRRRVEVADLTAAVDSVCVAHRFISENPFRAGKIAKLELK